MSQTPALKVRNLRTTFHTGRGSVEAVRGVSLTLEAGSSLAVVGESGAGKSVLMRSIIGIQPRGTRVTTTGSAEVAGTQMLGLRERERRRILGRSVGLIYQDPLTSLNPAYPVGDQLVEALINHQPDLGRSQRRRRGIEMLELMGFDDPERILRAYPDELSGGQRQRIGIAAAAICEPGLLIGDEPTTALDVTVQKQVLDLLDSLRQRSGSAFLLVTHDLALASERCDQVAVMRHGLIVEQGPAPRVLTAPEHPYTRALLGCIPRLDGPRPRRLATVPEEDGHE